MSIKDTGAIVRQAYADVLAIARDMWPVLLILSALYVLCAMSWFIAPLIVQSWIGRYVMRMLIFIGISWVATPYYIALHRYIALGETRWIPPRDRYGDAGRVYTGWAGLSVALWFSPIVGRELVDAVLDPLGAIVLLIGFIAIFVLLARMTTLLPAAALDPNRASFKRAMDDSRGKLWAYFFSTAGAAAPATILLLIIGRAAGQQTITAVPFMVLAAIALLGMQLIPLAAATRLYQRTTRDQTTSRLDRIIRPRSN